MKNQAEKAAQFQALHAAQEAFVIPNPWDIGSARLLALAGFKALATSSAGYAFSRGLPDNAVGRAQMMVHLAEIARATDLPVSADLENGFGDAPEECAKTIHLAAQAGVVGGSIEDATGDEAAPLFDIARAAERVAAAVEAARALPYPFVLTARTENFLRRHPDLDDTIRRLKEFEKAGADVLFAPGLPTLEAVRAVCQSVNKPVNFMAGIPGQSFSVAELAQAGVKRISLATSLYRAAMAGLRDAAHEVKTQGTFGYLNRL